jgi:hypothetical protein
MPDSEKCEPEFHVGFRTWGNHLLYMCKQAQVFVDEGRTEKAMRWLGFIKGVLYVQSNFTLDELKDHSKP